MMSTAVASVSNFQNETTSSSTSNPSFLTPSSTSNSGTTPSSTVSLLSNGIPGYQYTIVDPSNQYQKYLIVVLQVLSGTDPTDPPRYSPILVEDGNTLRIKIPLAPVMTNEEIMTDARVSWMREGSAGGVGFQQYKNTRLAGLGPAIAQINGFFNGKPLSTTWDLPLSEPCEKLIGSYSINNFPAQNGSSRFGTSFSPVVVEFKLSTVEQRVKKQTRVSAGLWEENAADFGEIEDDSSPLNEDPNQRHYFSAPGGYNQHATGGYSISESPRKRGRS